LEFRNLDVKDLKEIPGKGVVGYVAGCRVAVGNKELMKKIGVSRELTQIENDRHTRVYVSMDQCAPPTFCLVDEVRSDAADAVEALRERGIYTAMLTGDKTDVAQEVAERLNMNEVYAELFPEDKLKILAKLKAKHGLVAMVGDGINDAPVLAASDVGIAMGTGGVDVALESADIVLVKDELIKIPYLQRLSKLAVKIAKQNIFISLGVKLVLGALGFLGLIPLWFAVAGGDDGVTMLLLLNTLRLTR
jgi:Cd2+/Zn2+-exporting ATPase